MKHKSMETSSSRKHGLDNDDENAANVGKRKRTLSHIKDETCYEQSKTWKKCLKLEGHLFKDNSTSRGGQVKEAADVLQLRSKNCSIKNMNVSCRVEAFGKMCKSFDNHRKKWVREMGFGGLLNLVNMRLPRNLCYWLMTRMDPINKILIAPGGHEYLLSKNHVSWILGIPNGTKVVPRKVLTEEMQHKVSDIQRKYGRVWETKSKMSGKTRKHTVIYITPALMERAMGSWEANDEEEFKTLFLMLALMMVLCPTLAKQLDSGLLPALTCAMTANNYDWCGLVLEKLMLSIQRFAQKFYVDGYSYGCGGCSIFLAIFYLDHLDRDPVAWGEWPRIKVWTAKEMMKARDEDQIAPNKDFGNLRCLDVSYGERHPWEAWDMDCQASLREEELEPRFTIPIVRGKRKPRMKMLKQVMHSEMRLLENAREEMLQSEVPNEQPQTTEILADSSIVDSDAPTTEILVVSSIVDGDAPMVVPGVPDPHSENIILDNMRNTVEEEQNKDCGEVDGNGEKRLSSLSLKEMSITRLDDLVGQPELNREGFSHSLASSCHGSVHSNLVPIPEELHTGIIHCGKGVSLSMNYIENSTHVSSDCRKEMDVNAGNNIGPLPLCLTSPSNAANFCNLTPCVGKMHSENIASCNKITTTPETTGVGNLECLPRRSLSSDNSARKSNVDNNEIKTSQRSNVNVQKTSRTETFKERCEIIDLSSSDDENDNDSYVDPLIALGYYDMIARISKLKQEASSMKALKTSNNNPINPQM